MVKTKEECYISPYTLKIKWLRENLFSYKQQNLLHKYHDLKNKLLSYKIITIKWLKENLLSYKEQNLLHKYHDLKNKLLSYKIIVTLKIFIKHYIYIKNFVKLNTN
jgi:hypothetical protein